MSARVPFKLVPPHATPSAHGQTCGHGLTPLFRNRVRSMLAELHCCSAPRLFYCPLPSRGDPSYCWSESTPVAAADSLLLLVIVTVALTWSPLEPADRLLLHQLLLQALTYLCRSDQ
ncbi:hypothetical protein NL676_022553 [Syzygium grande]|nr:hypothetical protein NL676_022553 [Syzygium grande]